MIWLPMFAKFMFVGFLPPILISLVLQTPALNPFIKKKKSNLKRLCVTTFGKNLQIEHVVLKGIILFFLMKIYLLTSLSSKNFGFIIFVNQLFKVSTVNFNSTENNSAREADFSRAKTAEAASLAERKLSN